MWAGVKDFLQRDWPSRQFWASPTVQAQKAVKSPLPANT